MSQGHTSIVHGKMGEDTVFALLESHYPGRFKKVGHLFHSDDDSIVVKSCYYGDKDGRMRDKTALWFWADRAMDGSYGVFVLTGEPQEKDFTSVVERLPGVKNDHMMRAVAVDDLLPTLESLWR